MDPVATMGPTPEDEPVAKNSTVEKGSSPDPEVNGSTVASDHPAGGVTSQRDLPDSHPASMSIECNTNGEVSDASTKTTGGSVLDVPGRMDTTEDVDTLGGTVIEEALAASIENDPGKEDATTVQEADLDDSKDGQTEDLEHPSDGVQDAPADVVPELDSASNNDTMDRTANVMQDGESVSMVLPGVNMEREEAAGCNTSTNIENTSPGQQVQVECGMMSSPREVPSPRGDQACQEDPVLTPIVIEPQRSHPNANLSQECESNVVMEAGVTGDDSAVPDDTFEATEAVTTVADHLPYLKLTRSDPQNPGSSVLDNLQSMMKSRSSSPSLTITTASAGTRSKFTCNLCGKGFKYFSILGKHQARGCGRMASSIVIDGGAITTNQGQESAETGDSSKVNVDEIIRKVDEGNKNGDNAKMNVDEIVRKVNQDNKDGDDPDMNVDDVKMNVDDVKMNVDDEGGKDVKQVDDADVGEETMSEDTEEDTTSLKEAAETYAVVLVDGEIRFQCPNCSKTFKKKGFMQTHLRSFCDGNLSAPVPAAEAPGQSGNEFHACPECGKIFKRKTALDTHVKNHQKEELVDEEFISDTHVCMICQAVFRRKTALDSHMKVHEEEEGDSDTGLVEEKSAKIDKALRALKARFTMERCGSDDQEKRIVCSVVGCGSRFFSRKGLTSHENAHRRNGHKIPNPGSHTTVGESSGLVKPEALYPGEKGGWFCCQVCNRKYKYESALHWHERTLHGIVRDDDKSAPRVGAVPTDQGVTSQASGTTSQAATSQALATTSQGATSQATVTQAGDAAGSKNPELLSGKRPLIKGSPAKGAILEVLVEKLRLETVATVENQGSVRVGDQPGCGTESVPRPPLKRKRLFPNQCIVCRKIFRHKGAMINHKTKMHTEEEVKEAWDEYNTAKGMEVKRPRRALDVPSLGPRLMAQARAAVAQQDPPDVKPEMIPKPFVCGICGEGFAVLSELGGHMTLCLENKNKMTTMEAISSATAVATAKRVGGREGEDVESSQRNSEGSVDRADDIRNKCYECGVVCESKGAYFEHMSVHRKGSTSRDREQCKTCGRRFLFRASRLAHEELHRRGKAAGSWRCPECNASFTDEKQLGYHLRAHTNESSKCRICGMVFANPATWLRHMKRHAGIKTHPTCNICNKQVGSKAGMEVHMRQKHPNIVKSEPVSEPAPEPEPELRQEDGSVTVNRLTVKGREIQTQTDFTFQMDEDPQPEPDYYECFVCLKIFRSAPELYGHMTVHGGDNAMCAFCRKCFAGKGNLKIHILKHADRISKDTCRVCGKVYSSKWSLLKHASCHGYKKISWCPTCSKPFEDTDEFESHAEECVGDMAVQEDRSKEEYTHLCTYCDKKFMGSYRLRQHLRSHTGEKPFVCGLAWCSKAFTVPKSLRMHLETHHPGEAPVGMCSHCGFRADNLDAITHHVTRQHKSKLAEGSVLRLPEVKADYEPVGEFDDKGGIIYKCPVCKKVLPSPGNVRTHLRIHTGERPFACNICNKAFKQIGNMKTHYKCCHPRASLNMRCTLCGANYTSLKELGAHDTAVHGGGKVDHTRRASLGKKKRGVGIIPSRTRRNKQGSEEQMAWDAYEANPAGALDEEAHADAQSCEELPPVKLENLGDSVVEPGVIQSTTPAGIRIYKCAYCGKSWSAAYQVRDHVRTHTGERPFRCNLCSLTFSSADHMKHHFPKKHSTAPVSAMCTKCGESFSAVFEIKRHFLREHCPNLNSSSRRSSSVGSSVSDVARRAESRATAARSPDAIKQETDVAAHGKVNFLCQVCNNGREWGSQKRLADHMATHTGEKPYQCQQCGILFCHISSTKRHMFDKHTLQKAGKLECKLCGDVLKSSDIREHLFQEHVTKIDAATVPELRTSSMEEAAVSDGNLAEEEPELDEEPPELQEESLDTNRDESAKCSQELTQSDGLEVHVASVHKTTRDIDAYSTEARPEAVDGMAPEGDAGDSGPDRPSQEPAAEPGSGASRELHHKCTLCGSLFQSIDVLKQHMMCHSKETLYPCPECGAKFGRKDTAYQHMREVHQKEFRYESDVPSGGMPPDMMVAPDPVVKGEQTPLVESNDNHSPQTSKVRNKCNVCGKVFRIPNALEIHQRIHTGEKPYQCNICHQRFRQYQHLNKHKEAIHGEKPARFSCTVCERKFHQKCNLEAHFRNAHKFHSASAQEGDNAIDSTADAGKARLFKTLKKNQCGVCLRVMKGPTALKVHMRVHTGEKPFKCRLCNAAFRQSPHLKGHMERVHAEFTQGPGRGGARFGENFKKNSSESSMVCPESPGDTSFKCQVCHKSFLMNSSLMQHMKDAHKTLIYPCPLCDEGFTSPPELGEHLQLMHSSPKKKKQAKKVVDDNKMVQYEEEEDMEEEFADMDGEFDEEDLAELAEFETESQTASSPEKMSSSAEVKPLSCTTCGKKFVDKKALGAHQKAHRDGMPVCVCHACGHVSKKKDHLMFHMTKHIDKRVRQCKLCGHQSEKFEAIYAHMEEHMSDDGARCAGCGKGFPTQSDLDKHDCPTPEQSSPEADDSAEAAPEASSHVCQICGLAVQTPETLAAHLQSHRSGLPKSGGVLKKKGKTCPICRKTFYGMFNMQVHINSHQGGPIERCGVCGKAFSTRAQLNTHMQIHTGEKPYCCKVCGKRFTQSGHLKYHIDVHHTNPEDQMRYDCTICGVTYRDRRSVDRHMEVMHEISKQK